MIDYSIIGIHVDDSGLSRENIVADRRRMKCSWALVRNSPDLARMFYQDGVQTIYRQKSDGSNDDNATSYDPGTFVWERHKNAPPGGFIYGGNEIEPSPFYALWTTEFQKACHAKDVNRKGVILNHSYGKSEQQWAYHEKNIKDAADNGDMVGFHFYDNEKPNTRAGLWGWKRLYDKYGGLWGATEIAYFSDAYHGFRGDLDEKYVDFWQYWCPIFHALKIVLFPFSYERWPNNDEGGRTGFGYSDRDYMLDCFADMNTKYVIKGLPVIPSATQPTNPGISVAGTVLVGLNLRTSPSTGAIIRQMIIGEQVQVFPDTLKPDGTHNWIWLQDTKGNYGWAAIAEGNTKYISWGNPVPAFQLYAPFGQYKIVSRFNAPRPGYAVDFPGKLPLHEGTDFELPDGSLCDPVIHVGAVCQVAKIDYQEIGYGNYVIVDFGNGFSAVYAHLAEVWVKSGQRLIDRQIIGLMGETGTTTEPHVHLTLSNPKIGLSNYVYPFVVNPEDYLA